MLPGATLDLAAAIPDAPAGARFEAALDGGILTPLPEGRLQVPREGEHWLAAIARGSDGTTSAARWWRLRVEEDRVPPEIQWRIVSAAASASGADGGTIYGPPVTVEVTAADDRAGMDRLEWSVSGGAVLPLDPATGPASFETSAPKVHIAAFDRAGNKGFVEITWGVDWEPPTFLLRLADGRVALPGQELKVRQGTEAALEAVDHGVGVATQSYNLEGVWQNTPSTVVFQNPGRFTLEAQATDRLGNEARVSWPVKVKKAGGGS